MRKIKQRLNAGETLTGCWLNLGHSIISEIVGNAGFDWVLIDLEHGMGSEQDLLMQLQALSQTAATPIVRVENSDIQRTMRALDFGSEGIMYPRINDFDQAKKAVSGLRYPPKGRRGVARIVRATNFGDDAEEYFNNVDANILGIIQIETPNVLKDLDEISRLQGVDVLFIGPSDLSKSLGIFGQFDHPLYLDALEKTINAAKKANKATGILLSDPDDFEKYQKMGIQMIACGADVSFVKTGATDMASRLNAKK